jgi:hypothetical protein
LFKRYKYTYNKGNRKGKKEKKTSPPALPYREGASQAQKLVAEGEVVI